MADVDPDFFTDPTIVDDPKRYFDRMRAQCPVAKEHHHGSVMVTGYDEAVAVLTSRDSCWSSVVSTIGPVPPLPFQPQGDDIREQLEAHRHEIPWSDHLVCFDGQKHLDHRALLTRLLTYGRLKQNEDYLRGLTDRLIDGFVGAGHCDIVRDFAHATTTYAISDLMGIPEGDRAELLDLIGAPPSQIGGDAVHKIGSDPLIFLKERFDGYIARRLDQPHDESGHDLMAELAHSLYKDGSRPDPHMLSLLARFLFGAGQDTTSRLIAMGILVLAEDPGLQARLRAEPERVADFIEEVLRFDGPVKMIYRLAQTSTSIAGVDVPAGTVVDISLTGANTDPRHFADPARFDIDRPDVRDHLAFSRGLHACPGAPLARMEARIAIERFLARIGNVRLSEAHHGPRENRRFHFEPTYSFRSLADLYVEFEPA